MTSWKKDLDLLVEQTMTFVKSVAAANPAKAAHLESMVMVVKPVDVAQAILIQPPTPVPPPLSPLPASSSDAIRLTPENLKPMSWMASERDEIQQRVATFKAHQEKMQRDREDYYLKITEQTRAMIGNETPPRPLK